MSFNLSTKINNLYQIINGLVAGSVSNPMTSTLNANGNEITNVSKISGTNLKISTDPIAIGLGAGITSQGSRCIAIGCNAGNYSQVADGIAIGSGAGSTFQGQFSTAIGLNAGSYNQGLSSIAIGGGAGQTAQGDYAIAIGQQAGQTAQQANSIILNATGSSLNSTSSNALYIAPIRSASQSQVLCYNTSTKEVSYTSTPSFSLPTATNFGEYIVYNGSTYVVGGTTKIALGSNSGMNSQQFGGIAIGLNAGSNSQQADSIAIGDSAGVYTQGNQSIAIGFQSGFSSQNQNAVAIGAYAGSNSQGSGAVAIGLQAGANTQGSNCVAIGTGAGFNQKSNAIAIGLFSGQVQDSNTIALGTSAGSQNQQLNAIAIGNTAGYVSQASNAIAIGVNAGQTAQGSGAIAIGYFAGRTNQQANSIVINSSGTAINGDIANALYVAPIRNSSQSQTLYYNTSTKEITYANNYTPPVATAFGQYNIYNGSTYSVAGTSNVNLGSNAGLTAQGTGAVAIGIQSGQATQGLNSVAIGFKAGQTNQGTNSIAIGNLAGTSNLPSGTIHLNASGSVYNPTQSNALYISSVRNNTSQVSNPVYFNPATYEMTTNQNVVVSGTNTGDCVEGMYGDGSDGEITLSGYYNSESIFSTYDNTTTTYTLIRDIYPNNLTVNLGITLITAGYRIFCKNTLTNNGIIHNNGNNASGITAGTGALGGFFKAGGTGAGGIPTTAGGAVGSAPTAPTANTLVGNYGGRGACGRLNVGQYVGVANPTANMTIPSNAVGGRKIVSSTSAWSGPYQIGAGAFYQLTPSVGGCGGSKSALGTNATSGGGGGGGGVMFISAYNLTGTGSYQCKGGNGGNGVAGTTANVSGGGGGGAGGIIVVYTPPAVWSAMAGYFNVSGGTGGTTNYTGTTTGNYPLSIASASTNTGLLTGVFYTIPLSSFARTANYNIAYMVSIFTTTTSGLRCACQGVSGYIGKNGFWNYIATVDFGTQSRMELWYGFAQDSVDNDVMNDTSLRVQFDIPPTTYRVMVDEVANTALNDGYTPIGQSTTATSVSSSITTSLPFAPTIGNIIYTVVAKNGGTTPVAGTGNTLLNNQTTAPTMVSEVSTALSGALQQNNGMTWTGSTTAGAISVEISQSSVPESGAKGWEGRLIHLGS